jgi:hypothetical protein
MVIGLLLFQKIKGKQANLPYFFSTLWMKFQRHERRAVAVDGRNSSPIGNKKPKLSAVK